MDGTPASPPSPPHLAALFGVSAAVLAFEVLLLRLFEFSHWHHFAGLAVSLALLGLGAAGTVLTLLGHRRIAAGDGWLLAAIAFAAAALLLVLGLHAGLAVRPVIAGWDASELGKLLLVDFVALLPFLGAGLVIGQVFMRWPEHTARVYAANLLGSGAGSLAASVALAWAHVETAIAAVAVALASIALALALVWRRRWAVIACAVIAAGALAALARPPPAAVSDFKALSRLQQLPGARVLTERPGLPGRLTLIRADSLRSAPGLSLAWRRPVPVSDAAVIGSDRVVPMARHHPPPGDHWRAALAGLTARLRPRGRVLALGSGGWPIVAAGARVTWVEPDGRLLALAAGRGARYRLVEDAPRRHLAVTGERYDVITVRSAHAGGDAASEDYLLTVGGLAQALGRLRPDGLLALPLTLHQPPRHFPRILATLADALERGGATDAAARVAVVRSLQAVLILASPRPLGDSDVAAIEAFAGRWSFDLVWLPGLERARANRHHRLDSPAYFDSARAVLAGGAMPAGAARFNTAPVRTTRPYAWRSMRWPEVPRLLATLGPRGLTYLDWTLLLGAVATVAVGALALILIVAPLGRLPPVGGSFGRLSVIAYFVALGAGYMLLELALFQRAILFVGEPVLAAALVFALFLVGSGAGSATAPAALGRRTVLGVFAAVAGGLALAAGIVWAAADGLMIPPTGARMALLAVALVPLTWALGRPFPWGLRQLAGRPRWVPWAWGINAFASVAAAAAAPLISVQAGQPVTLGVGAVCYVLALAVALYWSRGRATHGAAAP